MKELSLRVVFSGEGLNARRWIIGFLTRSCLQVSISTTRRHKRAGQRSVPLPSRLPRGVHVRGKGVLGARLRALIRLEEDANGDDDDDQEHPAAQHGKEVPEEFTEQGEHHATHHKKAEPAVSAGCLAKSTCLTTDPHE